MNSSTESYLWDVAEGMPLLIQDGSTRYITGPDGLPIEQVDGSGNVLYSYQDQLGSTRGLLDGSGNTAATFTYDAYGNLKSSSGSAATPFGYAGQYTDTESGLQYHPRSDGHVWSPRLLKPRVRGLHGLPRAIARIWYDAGGAVGNNGVSTRDQSAGDGEYTVKPWNTVCTGSVRFQANLKCFLRSFLFDLLDTHEAWHFYALLFGTQLQYFFEILP